MKVDLPILRSVWCIENIINITFWHFAALFELGVLMSCIVCVLAIFALASAASHDAMTTLSRWRVHLSNVTHHLGLFLCVLGRDTSKYKFPFLSGFESRTDTLLVSHGCVCVCGFGVGQLTGLCLFIFNLEAKYISRLVSCCT